MIWWLNRGVGAIVDVVMAPLRFAPSLVGLATLALLTAVGMLLVFRVTLDRTRVATAKARMQAAIFEMRLYQDDTRAVLRAALDVVRHNGAYLRAWLVPTLIVSLPLTMLLAQIDSFYGFTGLPADRHTRLTVGLTQSDEPHLTLDVPPAIRVDTPPLWFPTANRVVWQLTPQSEGTFTIGVRSQSTTADVTLQVSESVARRSPRRVQANLADQLRFPSDPPLPGDAPFEFVAIEYPVRELAFFGWRGSWPVPYLLFTFLLTYGLRRRFGVAF